MSTYGDLWGAIARVVGGTQPTPSTNPYWYSGSDTGDGSGVAGIAGCWSFDPGVYADTPVGIVVPAGGKPLQEPPMQGQKFIEDVFRVGILVGHDDLQSQIARLAPFGDLVPSAFDGHMQLFGTPGVLAAICIQPRVLEVNVPPVYLAMEFEVHVQRRLAVTYTG